MIQVVHPSSADYPLALHTGSPGPAPSIQVIGNLGLLNHPLSALFCSAKCPGRMVLPAFDRVVQLRDAGQAVISGFHSPMEKECLALLLRGTSPIIICPARNLTKFRTPPDWKKPLADRRLLILSFFLNGPSRPTADTACRRNEFIAALARQILILYATPGGRLESMIRQLQRLPLCTPSRPQISVEYLGQSGSKPTHDRTVRPARALSTPFHNYAHVGGEGFWARTRRERGAYPH